MKTHPSDWSTRGAAITLAVVAATLLAGCGLIPIGGGPSQEEYDALAVQLEELNAQLEQAQTAVSKSTLVASQLSATQGELEQAKAQLLAGQAELDRLKALELEAGTVSLEGARLQAIRYARDNKEEYPKEFVDIPLVWEVQSAEEGEEFFYIKLTYRAWADTKKQPGQEEFIINKKGEIEFRQILTAPTDAPAVAPAP